VFCICLWGQADANKGQIAGTVYDPNQAVVPDAKVTIKNSQTGVTRQINTNETGQFRAVLLDAGVYDVTVEKSGFAQAVLTGVILNVGSAVDLPVNLKVGSTAETVEVAATLVNVDMPAPSTVINTHAIEDLPINGRRFQDFAALTPTVQIDQVRGSISFAGQRGINGNVMVDGTDYNNPFFGGTRGGERSGFVFTIPQSSVQEFQVITTGYAAEYGRSTGGILNAVSKSGTNEIHGEAFYQVRHKETGLKTPFGTQNLETLQQFGGGAGGAFKKDKLFWFAAAERQVSSLPRTVLFATLTGVAPTPQTQEALSFYHTLEQGFNSTNDGTATTGRLDYNVNERNRLTLRFNFSDASADNAITTGAPLPTIDTRALSGTGAEKDRTYTGIAQYTSIFGANMANDLRFSGTYELRPRTSNSAVPNVTNNIGNFGARNFLPTVQDDARYQINDGFSIIQGAHAIKFGGDYNYLTTTQVFGFNQFGTFSFGVTNTSQLLQYMSAAPGQNRFDNQQVRYALQIGNLLAAYNMHQIAFYAQDSWKITPQFQINYGIRWEGQINPTNAANNSEVVNAIKAVQFPDNGKFDPSSLHNNLNQWMPRFGFTYAPFKGSTKTVIRGHTGLFYAATPMLVYAAGTNNFRLPPGDLSLSYIPTIGSSDPTVYQVFKAAGVDLNTTKLDSLPILAPDKFTSALASLTGKTPNPFLSASFTGTANDYLNPRALQAGLGAEQQLAEGWVAGIQFNYVNTVHLERNRDYNLPFPTVRAADGRVVFARGNRPLPQYGQITIRESSARSMYRGMTLNTRYNAKRLQFGMQYTVAENFSDDDNERSAGGFTYENPFNMRAEYGYSNIDVRSQFAGYALLSLPWGIELSGSFRASTGQPIDPTAGSDANGDGSSSDRAYQAVGVPFERNAFRNYGYKIADFRFLKSFKIGEKVRIQFSTEMFNMFNFDNVVIGPALLNSANTIYGLGIDATGATVAPRTTFMQLKNADGSYNRSNNQIGTPFQAQFALRLMF
jgi:hypothetical protein